MSKRELTHFRRHTASMVFQKFGLHVHKTILENAAYGLHIQGVDSSEAKKRAVGWLERVGLAGFEDHYPAQLSGGMQQRVGLARALATDADILLMDEAFSALDPLIRTEMQNVLLELQQELHKTIVFITHDLDEALKLADYLVILRDGVVVQQDEPQNILLNPADDYVEDFVGDINRARVLRVRSVMTPLDGPPPPVDGTVDCEDNLERLIAISGGDTAHVYLATRDDVPVGLVEMKALVRALVPRAASGPREAGQGSP